MQARLKYAIAFFIALGIRMIPFRPANVEPLLGTMMPFSKRVSPLAGGAFALASFVIYDYFTAGIGTYTWETGLVYTLIGIAAGYYFQYFKQSRASYAAYAVIATLGGYCRANSLHHQQPHWQCSVCRLAQSNHPKIC